MRSMTRLPRKIKVAQNLENFNSGAGANSDLFV